jgi:hypothetical protein
MFVREANHYGNPVSVYDSEIKSTELVRQILFCFQKRRGKDLPRGAVFDSTVYLNPGAKKALADKGVQAFRDSIVDQIFSLTGTTPKVVKEVNGSYTIYCL